MLRVAIICGVATLALTAGRVSTAVAAEIKSLSGKDGRAIIVLTGEIVSGDTETFTAAVKQANDAGKLVANIRLNSQGGNLLEGVQLADAVRFGKISTNVGKNAVCASACFLVFAAGATKFANYTAQIGVHGASDEAGNETAASEAATVSMAKVAKELGVPSAIIGRMVVTPPVEMVWLSPQDLQSMGVTMVGRLSQVATATTPNQIPNQTAVSPTNEPLSLQPQAKAAAHTPTWEEFVGAATARSAQQNNGTPAYIRSCQPELKVCNSGLFYVDNNNTQILIKVTRDIHDKVLNRELCEINPTGDIRKCVDWDTGASHSDMKDKKGDWYQVSD